MSQYDLMLDFKLKVGHLDLFLWFSDYTFKAYKVCRGVYRFSLSVRLVRPSMRPCFTVASVSWSSDFAIYIEDGLMYENDSLG